MAALVWSRCGLSSACRPQTRFLTHVALPGPESDHRGAVGFDGVAEAASGAVR